MKDKSPFENVSNDKNIITSDDILGKDVIDFSGHTIGMITQLHIDKNNKAIVGISIDTGFMKPLVFVGIDLVKNFGVDAIYISKTPSSRYLGLLVFDKNGIQVGKVIKVKLYGSSAIKSLTISTGLVKKLKIPARYLNKIAINIFLKISIDELSEIEQD